jgi:hypothetical protein
MSNLSRRRLLLGAAASLPAMTLLGRSIPFPAPVAAFDHPGDAALSTDGQDPMIAANPTTGTVYLAWIEPAAGAHADDTDHHAVATPEGHTAMPPSGQVMLARSIDGGVTFGEPVVASGADPDVISYVGSSPLVVLGPAGEVYVAYERNVTLEGAAFGRDILRLARSDDDGQSFAPAVDVFADTDVLESGSFHDALVTPDGAVYLAWLSYRQYMPGNEAGDDPQTEVRVARSDDGGATFGPSVLVDDVSCECCRTALAVAPDGALYLAWRDKVPQGDDGDPIRDMVISRSDDRGASWSGPVAIHDDGWRFGQCPESGPVIAVDADGVVHAAWFTGKEGAAGIYYAASRDGGQTFSAPAALASDDYFPHANVRGSLGEGDVLWVTWDDSRTEAGAVDLARIDADGTATRIPLVGTAGRTPDVAVAADGPILTWLSDAGVQVALVAAAGAS